MSTLGNNLKALRQANSLNQPEFALHMKTTQQRVSEWECDKVEPSLYNILKILDFFAITFEELVEGISQE